LNFTLITTLGAIDLLGEITAVADTKIYCRTPSFRSSTAVTVIAWMCPCLSKSNVLRADQKTWKLSRSWKQLWKCVRKRQPISNQSISRQPVSTINDQRRPVDIVRGT